MTSKNDIAALRLSRGEGIGPATYTKLLQRYATAQGALDALPELAERSTAKRPLKAATQAQAEDELAALHKLGGQLLVKGQANYPALLVGFDDASPVLSALGRVELLNQPSIGMVGARNASGNGVRLAGLWAAELGQAGYVLVSGLARGIDGAAHKAALATGTVAVLAGGINHIYPPEHADLYAQMAEQGVLIAENAVGTVPTNQHFPRRNRIIAGLCVGTIIVEAAMKSGSLITARYALEYGREVLAVPGHPFDPRASGPNNLIKQGTAQLVESVADVLQALAMPLFKQPAPQQEAFNLTPQNLSMAAPQPFLAQKIQQLLGFSPLSVDDLVAQAQAPVNDVLTILLEWEIVGRLQRLPGNQVVLVSS